MGAGAVPVSRDGFRVERHDDSKVFCHSVQDKPGDPQMVSHLDTLARSDLEKREK